MEKINLSKEVKSLMGGFLGITGLNTFAMSLVWGINTLFLLENQLNLFEVFVVNAAFTGGMALFEIPTGVVADTMGRRASVLLSFLLVSLSTFGYAAGVWFPGNVLWFLLMSILLGLGFTFFSGAMEAWLVDALKSRGYEGNLDPLLGQGQVVASLAMVAGSVLGGFIATLGYVWPYLLRGGVLLVVLILGIVVIRDEGFSPRKVKWKEIPGEMSKITKDSWNLGMKKPSVRLLFFLSLLPAAFGMWGWYAWQPYILELWGDPSALWLTGIIAALVALASGLGASFVGVLSKIFTKRSHLLIISYTVQGLALLGVALLNNFWAVTIFFLLAMALRGIVMPVRGSLLHSLVPSSKRATLLSFDSLVSSAGGMTGQLGLGAFSQSFSIASGYLVGGILILGNIPLGFLLRGKRLPEDQFAQDQKENSKPPPDSSGGES